MILRKSVNKTKNTHHKTGTDGDFNQVLIWLRKGMQERNANTKNTPEIVADEDFSTQTGNWQIVATKGAATSIVKAVPLIIFPFVVFFIAYPSDTSFTSSGVSLLPPVSAATYFILTRSFVACGIFLLLT